MGPLVHAVGLQMHHHLWNGLRLWDLGQPFFMFISGVAMFFSYSKRWEDGETWRSTLAHALKRSMVLFSLGWAIYRIVPVDDNPHGAFLYDVLPQLAIASLIAFLMLRRPIGQQLAVAFGSIALTEILYRFWPVAGSGQPFVPGQNFGSHIDRLLLGGVSGEHWVAFNAVPSVAFVIWGVLAGKYLRQPGRPSRKASVLFLAGLGGIAAGLALSVFTPIIRHIATSSFVILSGGCCLLALALAYGVGGPSEVPKRDRLFPGRRHESHLHLPIRPDGRGGLAGTSRCTLLERRFRVGRANACGTRDRSREPGLDGRALFLSLPPQDIHQDIELRRSLLFLISVAAAVIVSFVPLSDLVRNGQPSDYYAHIPLVPLVSAFVLFRRRKDLYRGEPGSPLLGSAVMALGVGLLVLDRMSGPGLIAHAELCASGAIFFSAGSFLALFGRKAFRRALFPFAFLIFLIPLPLAWMERIVSALVVGSTVVTNMLFKAAGVPFLQEGRIFRLPIIDIEVAQQCSGIRSSLALLVTSVLAGQMFLKGPWRKIVLALAVVPVTILKNGIRIVTLYLLSYFVDMRIIQGGFLHRSGGFLFFGLGLVILGYILWLLRTPSSS